MSSPRKFETRLNVQRDCSRVDRTKVLANPRGLPRWMFSPRTVPRILPFVVVICNELLDWCEITSLLEVPTARLELRLIRGQDAPAMFDLLTDPLLYRFTSDRPPVSVEALAQVIVENPAIRLMEPSYG
jgi:hypothetical protein